MVHANPRVLHDTSRGLDRYLVIGGEGGGQSFSCGAPGSGLAAQGACTPQRGFHGRLSASTVTPALPALPYFDVVYTAKNGTQYHYDEEVYFEGDRFLLTSIVDPFGNVTKVHPGQVGQNYEVAQVTEPGGRSLVFTYGEPSVGVPFPPLQSVSLIDADGQTNLGVCIGFQYTTQYLTQVDRYDGPCPSQSTASVSVRTEKYSYEGTGANPPGIAQLADNMTSYIDPNGQVTTYAYYPATPLLDTGNAFSFFGDQQERVQYVIEADAAAGSASPAALAVAARVIGLRTLTSAGFEC